MNLLDLRAAHPALFLPQDWFRGEPFVRRILTDERRVLPRIRLPGIVPPLDAVGLPSAICIAVLYVAFPADVIWERFLWCDDLDRLDQRIYVGGASEANGHRFEIHRHLHVTEKWGTPLW